jgi:hypothetical protein
MNALIKSSMLLLPAIPLGIYLYAMADDEGFEAVRSQPQDPICKQDGERLARLQAKPSLDEGLRFMREIRCLQLWPQLQTIVDGLSNPSRSTALTSPKRAASDMISASDAAPPTASPASDDACKHDEDRLAELQAHPSINAAIRFASELKCPRLQPQLPAILDQLSHAAGSVEGGSRAPDTISAGEAAPPALESPAMEAKSVTRDDACKRDEERLADLQAKPSMEGAIRLKSELGCPEVWPQLLAILDSFSQAPQSAGAASPNEAPPKTISAGEAALPASEPPASEATSAASNDACKQDEERLAGLRTRPSSEEAARFAQDLRCETLRPQSLALTGALAKPSPPDSQSVPQDAGAERNATNETQLASQAAAAAERRIAQLESEKEALTAEVSRLQHDRESSRDEPAGPPASPPPAAPAAQPESEPVAALASLPEGMPARVLIRYLTNNADARAQAEKLANALARQGIDVADLRESRSAIRTELSFSYAPDETIAQRVGRLVGVAPVRRPQPKDALMVRPGTIELNLSSDSHLAAINTTSRRESNHE